MRPFLVHAVALVLAAFAVAASAAQPRLASLQIEIWPEYDRPQNLVILKGELAADAPLPAAVTLRIPASAGGPSAVAYADASGRLLNLGHQRESAGDFVLLRLALPQRSFHVEFYDALLASHAEREYRYTWPGDFAVERLSVLVKEPAAASAVSVSPQLDSAGTSPDGTKYRAGDFGALKAGEKWIVGVRYSKSDARSTTEILGASPAPAATKPTQPASSWGWWAGLAALALALAGSALFAAGRRKARALCTKCGRPAAPGERFCAGCGVPLKPKR